MANPQSSRYYVFIKPVIGNKYVKSAGPYIFSLLAIIVFVIFAIRPTVLTILDLQKSILDNQATLGTLDKKSKDLTDGKRNLDNLDPSIKTRINSRLPDQAAVTALIYALEQTATRSASISALQVQPATIYVESSGSGIKQQVGELLFSFNVQGPYAALLQTLDNITKSPRLINITSASLSKSTEGVIGLSISGKAYYLKE